VTKTILIRSEVSQLDAQGLSEEEIAQALRIPPGRVRKILDDQETRILTLPEPRPLPDPPKRKPRSTAPAVRRTPKPRPPHGGQQTGQKVHGTEGGYNMHRRYNTEVCPPCREAMQRRSALRRKKAKVLSTS
jgi:hypothetical protein